MSSPGSPPSHPGTGFGSHPAGLRTLFFTEMWERFSYYGMRAFLVLFMVDAIRTGGMGLTDETATAIYGLYTASVYVLCLPGGWIADRLIGAQKAIWTGGIVIMLGHFTLAIPSTATFFLGLMLVAIGTGLLKPNISAVVGELYGTEDVRRDAGFTLYYMGINVGGFLGPLVCSTLAESDRFGWHWGFAAAGIGMAAGLVYFRYSRKLLGDAGLHASLRAEVPEEQRQRRAIQQRLGIGALGILLVTFLLMSGIVVVDAVAIATEATLVVVLFGAAYLAYLLRFGGLTRVERGRVLAIFILSMAAALFWAGFEQAGSTLNLFAERFTERVYGGFEIPAGWFQTLNSAFILVLAPVFASAWVYLARRGREPSTPVKFAMGLLTLAAGFAVMIPAAELVAGGGTVLPTWLTVTYLLHTLGELMLSPVGLSATTKLAPRRYVGQMMGIWFLTSALGNLIAGLAAGRFNPESIGDMPMLYGQIVLMTAGTGIVLLLIYRPLRRLMAGIH